MAKSFFSRYWIPTLSAISLTLVGALAVLIQIRFTSSIWFSLLEVLVIRPFCFFWISWFCLIFVTANEVLKEYRRRIQVMVKTNPPAVGHKKPEIVKGEIACSYAKRVLIIFAGLPLI